MSKSLEHRLTCPLVEKWRNEHPDDNDGPCSLDCADELETFWRERVEPLIEAGNLMQERLAVLSDEVGASEAISSLAWRAALAKVKEP